MKYIKSEYNDLNENGNSWWNTLREVLVTKEQRNSSQETKKKGVNFRLNS